MKTTCWNSCRLETTNRLERPWTYVNTVVGAALAQGAFHKRQVSDHNTTVSVVYRHCCAKKKIVNLCSKAVQGDFSIDHSLQLERTSGWHQAGVDRYLIPGCRITVEQKLNQNYSMICHSVYYTKDQFLLESNSLITLTSFPLCLDATACCGILEN